MNNGIAAIEFGTTKLIVLAGRLKPDGLMELLGLGSVIYDDQHIGHINPQTEIALNTAVEQARRMSGLKLDSGVVGIPNEFCGLIRSQKDSALNGSMVSKADLQGICKAAGQYALPPDWQINRVFFDDFLIDGQAVAHPLAHTGGSTLGASAYLLCTHQPFLQQAVRLLSRCGLTMEEALPAGVVQGEVFLTDKERQQGAILVDIGGYATDIVVYRKGIPVHMDWIPLGGAAVTSDVSKGMNISLKDAEKLKRNCVLGLDMKGDDTEDGLEFPVRSGNRVLNIPAGFLQTVVESRVEELLELIKKSLADVPGLADDSIVVITGGGVALLRGAREFAMGLLARPVRLGVPDCIGLSSPALAAPYALAYNKFSASSTTKGTAPMAGFRKTLKFIKYLIHRR